MSEIFKKNWSYTMQIRIIYNQTSNYIKFNLNLRKKGM